MRGGASLGVGQEAEHPAEADGEHQGAVGADVGGVDDAHQAGHGDQGLEIRVRDDGAATRDWVPGVGLSSMRERAAEVGGTLEVRTGDGGTAVLAELPLT